MSKLRTRQVAKAILLVWVCIVSSCSQPKGVLSQSDMTDVLIDMHKIDAIIEIKGLTYSNADIKKEYYESVLRKHGISQAQFDSSLVWYTQNPKRFERVYDRVMTNLTTFQKDIQDGKYQTRLSDEILFGRVGIWQNRTKFVITPDSQRTRLKFKIPDRNFMLGDVYVLRFYHKIAPSDSSTNPHIRLLIHYTDGRIQGIIQKTYNDGKLRRYTIKLPARHACKIQFISGELLGCSTFKGKANATIDSISFVQTYNPGIQDSLLKILQKRDPKNYPTYINMEDSVMDQQLHQNIRSLILRAK